MDNGDFQEFIIMNDFNFPKVCWSKNSDSSISSDNGIEYEFFDTLNENYQHVNIPTFRLSNENVKYYNNVRKRQLISFKISFSQFNKIGYTIYIF